MPATDSVQVRRALLSVSDKTNLIDFAQGLHDLGVQLVSTGGTFRDASRCRPTGYRSLFSH